MKRNVILSILVLAVWLSERKERQAQAESDAQGNGEPTILPEK